MPTAPVAPVAPKMEIWFEAYLVPLKEALKAGARRPRRVFGSNDPLWAEIEKAAKGLARKVAKAKR